MNDDELETRLRDAAPNVAVPAGLAERRADLFRRARTRRGRPRVGITGAILSLVLVGGGTIAVAGGDHMTPWGWMADNSFTIEQPAGENCFVGIRVTWDGVREDDPMVQEAKSILNSIDLENLDIADALAEGRAANDTAPEISRLGEGVHQAELRGRRRERDRDRALGLRSRGLARPARVGGSHDSRRRPDSVEGRQSHVVRSRRAERRRHRRGVRRLDRLAGTRQRVSAAALESRLTRDSHGAASTSTRRPRYRMPPGASNSIHLRSAAEASGIAQRTWRQRTASNDAGARGGAEASGIAWRQGMRRYNPGVRIRPIDLVDVFVYLVVLGLFIQLFPDVIAETFVVALLTAVLLKIVLEAVLVLKKWVGRRIREARNGWARAVNIVVLVLVLPGSKFLVLELVALTFQGSVHLGNFLQVTALIIALMLARGGMRRLFDARQAM